MAILDFSPVHPLAARVALAIPMSVGVIEANIPGEYAVQFGLELG